ncbi:flagellar hook-length control protein FliK [Arcobacter vandammei]|uniref:flagellar hook-length control protein FliK n=1 Tax=Arcobacter vandammei TaxID=2782243 RepID=UPI0018E00250|nr:flagellar hook-length control protein FliK [Arcobacter vandammei]
MNAIDIFIQEGTSLDSGSSLLGGQKDEKTGMSLFDSILKSSIDTKAQLDINIETKSSNNLKMVTNGMENITTTIGSSSLLDKMLIEAKELISNGEVVDTTKENIDESTQSNPKFLDSLKDAILDLDESKEVILKTETKAEIKTDSKVDLTQDLKPQTDSSSSLLDKLVSDAKKDILVKDTNNSLVSENKNLLSEEIKSEIKIEDKSELKLQTDSSSSLLDKLVSDAKKDILVKDTNNTPNQSIQIVQETLEQEATIIQTNVKDEVVKVENSPTALLDKLISDAKNKIVEDKNNLNEQKTTQTSQVIVDVGDKEIVSTTTIQSDIVLDEANGVIKNEATIKNDEKVIILNTKPIEVLNGVENNIIEQVEEQKPKSLMDALIQNSMKKQEEFVNKNIDLTQVDKQSKEVVSNIYLGEQKNQINTQLNFNKTEAMKLLKDGASLEDIQKSAAILDLDANGVDVEQTTSLDEVIKKNNLRDLSDKKIILDSLLNEKNIRSVDVRNLITKSVEASAALLENSLNIEEDKLVNVNSPLSFNIQTKIIGARQQMTNMMSDIARQMYENYKPPVTVFRINLHPEHLGTIAIMMKSERNSDVSISMSVSSQATLDALMENQNLLRNSLNKTFDENTKFNLDFNSGEKNQDGNQQQKQEEQRNQDEHIDTQTILKLQEENKEIDDKFDYM